MQAQNGVVIIRMQNWQKHGFKALTGKKFISYTPVCTISDFTKTMPSSLRLLDSVLVNMISGRSYNTSTHMYLITQGMLAIMNSIYQSSIKMEGGS